MDRTSTKSNWWEDFFQGIALDFWSAVVNPEQTNAEADFIQRHLQLPAGGRVLDVPCGNGRLSIELASRGYKLTGVDIASDFIEEARTKSTGKGLQVEWSKREMRDLPWHKEFAGAFCFGNSFGYLEDEENVDFLRAVGGTLANGARFIIEMGAVAESLFPLFQEHREFEFGGITLVIDSRYDHERGRTFTDYTFIRDGQRDKRPASQRIYTYRELTTMLREAGFEIVGAYSSVTEEPYKLASPKLLLVSTKRND
jgi:SAM-dependent methyltransferase